MKLKRLLTVLLAVLLVSAMSGSALAVNKTAVKESTTKPTLKISNVPNSVESGMYATFNLNASVPGFVTILVSNEFGSVVLTIADNAEIHSKDTTYSFSAVDDSENRLSVGNYTISASMTTQYGTPSDTVTKTFAVTPTELDDDEEDTVGTAGGYGYGTQATAGSYGYGTQGTASTVSGTAGTGTASGTASGGIAGIVSGTSNANSGTSTDTYGYNTGSSSSTAAASNYGYNTGTGSSAATSNYGYNPGTGSSSTSSSNYGYGTGSGYGYSTDGDDSEGTDGAPVIVHATPIPQTVTYSTSGNYITMGEEGVQIGVGVSDVYSQATPNYWTLTSESTDAEIWQALIQPIVSVNLDEKESSYIYDSVNEGRTKLGTVSGLTQGLNVLVSRSDGWSLVEAYRNEDGAFIRGYIRTNRLKTVDVSTSYGIVIDKATQTLTVYAGGAPIGSCLVCTGLPTYDYLQRETPAGEFITATRRGTTDYISKGYSKFTIRINNNVYLQEIPTTKKGGSDYSLLESQLGQKATRGTICIQAKASMNNGINAEWIWNMTDANKKVKVLIFDDKPRNSVPIGK